MSPVISILTRNCFVISCNVRQKFIAGQKRDDSENEQVTKRYEHVQFPPENEIQHKDTCNKTNSLLVKKN